MYFMRNGRDTAWQNDTKKTNKDQENVDTRRQLVLKVNKKDLMVSGVRKTFWKTVPDFSTHSVSPGR